MASYEVGHPTFRVSMSWDLRQSHNHGNHCDVVTSWFSLWCSFHGGPQSLGAQMRCLEPWLILPHGEMYVLVVEPGHRVFSHVKWEQQFLVMFFYDHSMDKWIWVWVNTYRYIFSGMNIHKSQLFWCSPGVPGFWPIPILMRAFLLPGHCLLFATCPSCRRFSASIWAVDPIQFREDNGLCRLGRAQSSWNDGNAIGMYKQV